MERREQCEDFLLVTVGHKTRDGDLHIQLDQEEEITSQHLQSVASFIKESSRRGKKVVISSSLGTGVAAVFCICYLVHHHHHTRREAVTLLERRRPRARLARSALLEVAEEAGSGGSYDQTLSSISQSWLPTIFFLLFLFLLLRTVFSYLGLDRKCIYQVFQYLHQQLAGLNNS